MEFKIGQLIKFDDSYYIVDGLSETGRPNKIYRANKYGEITVEAALKNPSKNGWEVTWEIVKPLDIKHAKYEKVISKIYQLDHKFQNRSQTKKDLTASNLADIMTRLSESLQRANSTGAALYSTGPSVLTATDYDF
jgi:hypothetical protein